MMTRSNWIAIGVLLVGGWGLGTLLSLVADASALSLAVNVAGTGGGLVALAALVPGAHSAWAWGGTGVAAAAFAVGAVVPASPIWAAGACWIFVIVVGVAASRADTATDGALEAFAGAAAVLPVIPLALHESLMWVVTFLAAGAVNTAIIFGHRHRTAERRLEAVRMEIQMAERTAMARELHDVIAHEVTGIVVLAQAGIAAGADPDGTLARIERSGARALADIRTMVETLRESGDEPAPRAPSAAGEGGLATTLAELEHDGVEVRVDPDADAPGVSDLVRLVAQRVVTEGLTNARRHAPGGRVRIAVLRAGDQLQVDVADDGPAACAPPGPGPGGGVGLIGLTERADTVGGTLTYGRQGAGWLLSARLPIAAEA